MTFFSQLEARIKNANTLLCVGLDPHPQDLRENTAKAARDFCLHLIEETQAYTAAYKPNSAFFEIFGAEGIDALAEVISMIPKEIPVLLDAKRGDIGSTSAAYAQVAFETLKAGAITVNPYLGIDGVAPFIDNESHAVFLLCKTSNPSSGDLQDQMLQSGETVYTHIAKLAQGWNRKDNIGLVIGATYPEILAEVRAVAPDLWFLTPGVGAQGGDLKEALQAGLRQDGLGMLIPVSRGIARAENPALAAKTFRDEINAQREIFVPSANFPYAKLAQALLDLGCVQFGSFKLKSGKVSPIYLDLRRLSGDPQVLQMAARAYSDLLNNLTYDRVAGLPYAAVPVATAISLQTKKPLIYPRKETKDYGTKSTVEGPYNAGERIVVIDDLVTTGLSKFEAIEKLTDAGLAVDDIVVLIDRESGAKEALAQKDLNLHAVFTLTQLLEIWQASGAISETQVAEVNAFLVEV